MYNIYLIFLRINFREFRESNCENLKKFNNSQEFLHTEENFHVFLLCLKYCLQVKNTLVHSLNFYFLTFTFPNFQYDP